MAVFESVVNDKTISRIRASSVLDRKRCFRPLNVIDKNKQTCWNSDQGTNQSLELEFAVPISFERIQLCFQGGFVAREVHLIVDSNVIEEFEPEDSNDVQTFDLNQPLEGISKLKLLFPFSTDFYGRIVLYQLDLLLQC